MIHLGNTKLKRTASRIFSQEPEKSYQWATKKKKKLNTIFPRVTFSLISRTASLFAGNTYRFRLTRYILYPAADRVSLRENIYNTVHFPRNFFPLTSWTLPLFARRVMDPQLRRDPLPAMWTQTPHTAASGRAEVGGRVTGNRCDGAGVHGGGVKQVCVCACVCVAELYS